MEVWIRDPEPYVRECLQHGTRQFMFRGDFLRNRDIDVERFVDLFLAPPLDYRVLVVEPSGTVELQRGYTLARPKAVYPTWDYLLDDIATLEDILSAPVGADWRVCNDDTCPLPERPVFGQEHRVVVTGTPSVKTGMGRRFIATLRDMQADYPKALLHVQGLSSFRLMFGFGFGAADYDASATARTNAISLPNGREINTKDIPKWQKWITLLGFKPADMQEQRNRTLYNLAAADWAAEHFASDSRFRVRGRAVVDPDAIDPPIPVVKGVVTGSSAGTVGDKVLCDTCSLAPKCKFFRDGEVCSLPGSETATLAKLFRSRDPDQIIDGLGSILSFQTERLEEAREAERDFGGKDGAVLDPEVTKLARSIFEQGGKLAKLLDPARFGPKVAISLPGGGGHQAALSPAQQVAQVMNELRSQGYSNDEITPELVESFIAERSGALARPALNAPIDAQVVEDDDSDPDDTSF